MLSIGEMVRYHPSGVQEGRPSRFPSRRGLLSGYVTGAWNLSVLLYITSGMDEGNDNSQSVVRQNEVARGTGNLESSQTQAKFYEPDVADGDIAEALVHFLKHGSYGRSLVVTANVQLMPLVPKASVSSRFGCGPA